MSDLKVMTCAISGKKTIVDDNGDGTATVICSLQKGVEAYKRIEQLEKENSEFLQLACDIQSMCIGELTMGYKIDPCLVGEMISKYTGFTAEELRLKLKDNNND